MDTLQTIQTLQFTNREEAERLLTQFIAETFSLSVERVELRPLAISLNSFNGFLTLDDGRRLFFKTHTEQDTVIGEYYHATMLAEVGYPIVQPIMASTEAGKQLLIYELIEDPSVFDLAWQIECGDVSLLEKLTFAQHAADEHLLQIYLKTLAWQEAEAAARAPVHQLFWHRLTGGRLERFYGSVASPSAAAEINISLPHGFFPMAAVNDVQWIINGQAYSQTLRGVISQAARLLHPAQAGPSVIGHGDAHNGNVFFREGTSPPSLLYFDPAFAGRHDPLLDLTKPLFHNVYAMWMYFPSEKAVHTHFAVHVEGNRWTVEHDYAVPQVRRMFLESKVERVLVPLLQHLRKKGWLRQDWRDYVKAALFCCPFLTMNLSDPAKFPPGISLLGLCASIEMGSASVGHRSEIDRLLVKIAQQLE